MVLDTRVRVVAVVAVSKLVRNLCLVLTQFRLVVVARHQQHLVKQLALAAAAELKVLGVAVMVAVQAVELAVAVLFLAVQAGRGRRAVSRAVR